MLVIVGLGVYVNVEGRVVEAGVSVEVAVDVSVEVTVLDVTFAGKVLDDSGSNPSSSSLLNTANNATVLIAKAVIAIPPRISHVEVLTLPFF